MDNKMKEILWVHTGVNARRREGSFHGCKGRERYNYYHSILNRCTCKMARNLSLSSVGKTEK